MFVNVFLLYLEVPKSDNFISYISLSDPSYKILQGLISKWYKFYYFKSTKALIVFFKHKYIFSKSGSVLS